MTATAKVFRTGASQAVRLPKEFRFDVPEVRIRKLGAAVVLFTEDAAWDLFEEAVRDVEPDFMPERAQPKCAEDRAPW